MVRTPATLTTSLIFNGPFVSGNVLSKSLTSIYDHDYIRISARVYGFGEWDVEYPVWLNGLSVFVNRSDEDAESLVWFGSFLNDGGAANLKCDISEYKQWSSWSQPTTLRGLPMDILTENSCYYDLDLFLKHDAIKEPFPAPYVGDLQDSDCLRRLN